MKEFLVNHIETILAYLFGAGGLFSAWTERKKRKQEFVQAETQNQQQVVDLYQEALDDLKKRYDEKFSELEGELKQLRTNLDLWKGKYRTLKREFDTYRKAHEN
jgi:molecular chaperone GrpE (heat shock protein)